MPPLTPNQKAYKTLLAFIKQEEARRKRVYQFNSPDLAEQLQETDSAKAALATLGQAIKHQQTTEQAALLTS